MVVVSHNREAELRRCLTALAASEALEEIETIVVDNGSTDGSAELEPEFPHTRFIRVPRNFGLTKAMNLGWRSAQADYVFFLHEDTEVSPDTRLEEQIAESIIWYDSSAPANGRVGRKPLYPVRWCDSVNCQMEAPRCCGEEE